MHKRAFSIALIMFTLILTGSLFARDNIVHAQTEQPQTLDEIFNPEKDYGNDGKPLTPEFMANHYYKGCMATESLTMTPEEKELLCTCTAAKSSELLLVKEFKALEERSKAGKFARGKFLAYAYVPCIPFVMERLIKEDCKKNKALQDIVRGKNEICNCVKGEYITYIKQNEPLVLDRALREHPMTLNPLEYYLRDGAYHSQRDLTIKKCKYRFLYNRDN